MPDNNLTDRNMTEKNNLITINAKLDIATGALQAVVENARQITGRNEKGHYKVDTADMVGEMISRFLLENDFESFARNIDNYK